MQIIPFTGGKNSRVIQLLSHISNSILELPEINDCLDKRRMQICTVKMVSFMKIIIANYMIRTVGENSAINPAPPYWEIRRKVFAVNKFQSK